MKARIPDKSVSAKAPPCAPDLQGIVEADTQSFPILTIFSIPKPFEGRDDLHQRNAINSWKRLIGSDNVVLIGDCEVEPVANELGVRCVTGVKTNADGTPLIGSAFDLVQQHSGTPYLAYSNCDIILFDEFVSAIEMLADKPGFANFFATNRRINLTVDRLVDFRNEAEVESLKQSAKMRGRIESLVCKEVMVYPRELFEFIPDFAVGRGNWDNWMVYRAKQLGVPVIRLSEDIPTIHQEHDYSPKLSGSRLRCYVTSDEARTNQRLAGGRHLITGTTCDYILNRTGLKPSSFKWLHGEFWRDFPRFAGLLMQLAGWDRRK